ncbi:MAG: hypothetical protein KUG69_04095 [Marinosulfonomonas sp.]|nr:hypothetical protein [Marinosulfonomonas sp.]
MAKTFLTVLAFIVVSFGVQGLSHFVINADHFAAIGFIRAEPVLPMGIAAMIVQALIFSFVMPRLWPSGATIRQGVIVSACFGLFLASYIVLAEPAKYAAPSIPAWMTIESLASFVQFGVFGVLLGLIYRKTVTP